MARNEKSTKLSRAPDQRPKTSSDSKTSFFKRRAHLADTKRDSLLAPSVVTSTRDSAVEPLPGSKSQSYATSPADESPAVPSITLNGDTQHVAQEAALHPRPHTAPGHPVSPRASESHAEPVESPTFNSFIPLKTSIDAGTFSDLFTEEHLSFSKRGSVMLDGMKANASLGGSTPGSRSQRTSPQMTPQPAQSPMLGVPERSNSVNDRRASQKIRSTYETGMEESDLGITTPPTIVEDQVTPRTSNDDTVTDLPRIASPAPHANGGLTPPGRPRSSQRRDGSIKSSYIKMGPSEAAGGFENWDGVQSLDVDRYGFIRRRPSTSRSSMRSHHSHDDTHDQANGTATTSPNTSPTKSRKLRRHRLSVASRNSTSSRPHSRQSLAYSVFSTHSHSTPAPLRPSPNRGRRWADAAPYMLSGRVGLPDAQVPPRVLLTDHQKHLREQRRLEKWEKMAQPGPTAHHALGGGQSFTFDVQSPKLVERVWKGIPDAWRAPAWYSFLRQSSLAGHGKEFVADEELLRRYHAHQEVDCVHDLQIDLDVPRTVGAHVLFNVRYRGGQRLLFRLLHALALEFPECGYVQGMGPPVAMLLNYFEEERAFVVAWRLWVDRGLRDLFLPDFPVLMEQLQVLEKEWLRKGPVGALLEKTGMQVLDVGLKWYLPLYCYTMPVEAHLRVWDVIMLHGTAKGGTGGVANPVTGSAGGTANEHGKGDDGRFDILHATAAALFDANVHVLVRGDYGEALQALTTELEVTREDVLMKVVKREWEERQRRRK